MTTETLKCEHIPQEQWVKNFHEFHGKAAITHGRYETTSPAPPEDLMWNHMDQQHRPCVHGTYLQSLRLGRSATYANSLTIKKLAGIPFVMTVNDMRLSDRVCYQTFSFFNLIHVHVFMTLVEEGTGTREKADWYIVSDPFFKFAHGYLNKRYQTLTEVQNKQDDPIRERRREIRDKGYHFAYEQPDFVNSNTLTSNVRFPKLRAKHTVSLSGASESSLHKISAEEVDFLVRKEGSSYTVWTEACPHEGASLSEGEACNGVIECIWHGLRFPGLKLSSTKTSGELGPYKLRLESDRLHIENAHKQFLSFR